MVHQPPSPTESGRGWLMTGSSTASLSSDLRELPWAIAPTRIAHDNVEPVINIDHRDQGRQRGDLIVVAIRTHRLPSHVTDAAGRVRDPCAFLGQRECSPLCVREDRGLTPSGDEMGAGGTRHGGRSVVRSRVGGVDSAVDVAGPQQHQLLGRGWQTKLLQNRPTRRTEMPRCLRRSRGRIAEQTQMSGHAMNCVSVV